MTPSSDRLDVDPDELEPGDLLEETEHGGVIHRLVACPACLKRFSRERGDHISAHIALHDPGDFGKSIEELQDEPPKPPLGSRDQLAADGGIEL